MKEREYEQKKRKQKSRVIFVNGRQVFPQAVEQCNQLQITNCEEMCVVRKEV